MAGGKSAILSVKILGDASSAVKAMHETEECFFRPALDPLTPAYPLLRPYMKAFFV